MSKVLALICSLFISVSVMAVNLTPGKYQGTTSKNQACHLEIKLKNLDYDSADYYTFNVQVDKISNRFAYVSSSTQTDKNGIFAASESSDENIHAFTKTMLEVQIDSQSNVINYELVKKSNSHWVPSKYRDVLAGCYNLSML